MFQAHLLSISTTHNKNQNPLLNVLINCISAKSTPQILSIKGKCTFLLLNFPIIGLCNYFANSLLEIFLFLIPLPEVFFQNIYKPFKQELFDIYHILDL